MRALATIPESSSRPNGREAVPLIINNDGLILGETYVEEIARDAVQPQAILWDKNLVVINPTKQIPSNWAGPDVVFQAGESINDAGEVAGVINTLVPPSGIGVTYKDGIFTSFDLQDWTARIKLKSENAGGPNKKGEVVGQALNEPFIWENGEWQNNPSSGDTNYHPFTNGTSLNTLIPYGSGIHLDYAFCINDNGDILCRGTANGNSLEHGYLLSSPVHLDITADAINKDDPLSSAFSPLDTGVVYGGSEASTADDLRMTAALTPAINASYTWSVSGLSRTSSGQQWDFGAVLPKPGVLTFTCKAVTTDGHVYTATKDVEVSIRTDDIIVVGWINGDTVTLPSSGVSGWLKKILPSAGPPVPSYVDAYWLLYQLSSGYTDISAPVNHNLSKWTDRIYILNWLFKYAANLPPSDNLNFGDFRDSSDNCIDYQKVAEFVAQPTNYKLFNHLQIKYRVGANGFNGAPIVLKQETGVGTTHSPFPVLNPPLQNISAELVPGQEGFSNMHKAVSLLDCVELINDGSPDAHAVGAFDTLLGRNLPNGHSPLLWEDIGSKIRFDWNGGTKPMLTPLIFANFPTYWVYNNGKLLDVEPQAANPSDHFTANPYPFGLSALYTPAGASYFYNVGDANVAPPLDADVPPYTISLP